MLYLEKYTIMGDKNSYKSIFEGPVYYFLHHFGRPTLGFKILWGLCMNNTTKFTSYLSEI